MAPLEGVPRVPPALPRRRRAVPQRDAQRRAGGAAGRRPTPRAGRGVPSGHRRTLPAPRAAARALLPHRRPLRVLRVHGARVPPPRAGAAGRGAPRERDPAESQTGGHPETDHPGRDPPRRAAEATYPDPEFSLQPGLGGLQQIHQPDASPGVAADLGIEEH